MTNKPRHRARSDQTQPGHRPNTAHVASAIPTIEDGVRQQEQEHPPPLHLITRPNRPTTPRTVSLRASHPGLDRSDRIDGSHSNRRRRVAGAVTARLRSAFKPRNIVLGEVRVVVQRMSDFLHRPEKGPTESRYKVGQVCLRLVTDRRTAQVNRSEMRPRRALSDPAAECIEYAGGAIERSRRW